MTVIEMARELGKKIQQEESYIALMNAQRAVEEDDELQEKYGISAEVIDARSVVPFNYDLVIESVKKTGKIVLASDACERSSILKRAYSPPGRRYGHSASGRGTDPR